MFGNLFGGMGGIFSKPADPWAGMREVGQHAQNVQPTTRQRAHSMFGSMAAMPQQQPMQPAPVQFGGPSSGDQLSQLITALLSKGNR